MKLFSIFLLFILLTACSFNKLFLQPSKIPSATPQIKFKNETDTTVVFFSGENHQPTFTKNGKDTIDPGFTIESVVFTSSNGNKLNGWLLKPIDTIPTITLLHFHGNAGCLLSQYEAMSPLIKHGFQIFLFDYSGFGFSEGKATKKNTLKDGFSALDYLNSREDVKNTKLIIYGQSLGGHLSAVVASLRQTEIDALVVEGAFSSHKDIAAKIVPVLGRIVVKQSYSAKKSIKDFHKPVLIIHSTEDAVIPIELGEKIYDAANSPKEFFEIQHCHMCGPQFYSEQIALKIKKMVEE